MIDGRVPFPAAHPNFAYWLDTGIKLAALGLGTIWTFTHYKRSGTPAEDIAPSPTITDEIEEARKLPKRYISFSSSTHGRPENKQETARIVRLLKAQDEADHKAQIAIQAEKRASSS